MVWGLQILENSLVSNAETSLILMVLGLQNFGTCGSVGLCVVGLLSLYELVHFGFVVSSTGWICVFSWRCLERFLFDSMCVQCYVFFYRAFVLLINI